jgi:hypothetical protein
MCIIALATCVSVPRGGALLVPCAPPALGPTSERLITGCADVRVYQTHMRLLAADTPHDDDRHTLWHLLMCSHEGWMAPTLPT